MNKAISSLVIATVTFGFLTSAYSQTAAELREKFNNVELRHKEIAELKFSKPLQALTGHQLHFQGEYAKYVFDTLIRNPAVTEEITLSEQQNNVLRLCANKTSVDCAIADRSIDEDIRGLNGVITAMSIKTEEMASFGDKDFHSVTRLTLKQVSELAQYFSMAVSLHERIIEKRMTKVILRSILSDLSKVVMYTAERDSRFFAGFAPCLSAGTIGDRGHKACAAFRSEANLANYNSAGGEAVMELLRVLNKSGTALGVEGLELNLMNRIMASAVNILENGLVGAHTKQQAAINHLYSMTNFAQRVGADVVKNRNRESFRSMHHAIGIIRAQLGILDHLIKASQPLGKEVKVKLTMNGS